MSKGVPITEEIGGRQCVIGTDSSDGEKTWRGRFSFVHLNLANDRDGFKSRDEAVQWAQKAAKEAIDAFNA